jgi:hypothetical protein
LNYLSYFGAQLATYKAEAMLQTEDSWNDGRLIDAMLEGPAGVDCPWSPALDLNEEPVAETNNDWELFSDLASMAENEQDIQLAIDLAKGTTPTPCGFSPIAPAASASISCASRLFADDSPSKQPQRTDDDTSYLAVLKSRSPLEYRSQPLMGEQGGLDHRGLEQVMSTMQEPVDHLLNVNTSYPDENPDIDLGREWSTTPVDEHLMEPPGISPLAPKRRRFSGNGEQGGIRKRGRPCETAEHTAIDSKRVERLPGEAEPDFRRRRNRAHAAISRARKDEQIGVFLQKAEGLAEQVALAKKTLKQTDRLNVLFMRALVKEFGEEGKRLVTGVLQKSQAEELLLGA